MFLSVTDVMGGRSHAAVVLDCSGLKLLLRMNLCIATEEVAKEVARKKKERCLYFVSSCQFLKTPPQSYAIFPPRTNTS